MSATSRRVLPVAVVLAALLVVLVALTGRAAPAGARAADAAVSVAPSGPPTDSGPPPEPAACPVTAPSRTQSAQFVPGRRVTRLAEPVCTSTHEVPGGLKAVVTPEDKKRLAYYDDAHKLLLSTAAIAPMYNRLSFVLVKPNVKELTMTPLDGALRGDFNLGKTFIGQ